MAWNRSENVAGQPAKRRSEKSTNSPRMLRGVIAAAIVVVGAAVAWYFVGGEETTREARQTKRAPGVIEEVKPAAAAKVEAPKDEFITNRHGQVVKKIVEKTYVDERGILRYEGGARVYDHTKKRTPIKAMNNDPFPKLKNRSDYEIATLITIQPGMSLHGSVNYDEKFKESFVKSLMEKNEPEEGDTEWDKELKASVEETKKELAERIRAGEDLGEILKETREEVQRLAAYKRDINALISETMRNPDASDEDVADTVKAANKMLEEKGIAPFSENSFIRGRTRMFIAEQKKLERMKREGVKVER